jgi:hypothetical protein
LHLSVACGARSQVNAIARSRASMEDHGKNAEDAVDRICQMHFLADFTVRSPKFKKAGGQEKEAADFLVPFGTTLIAFQVKSRMGRVASEDDHQHFQRVRNRIDEGIDQLKTIKRALAAGRLAGLRNQVGLELPFRGSAVTRLLGVVVFDLPEERTSPEDERTMISAGFEVRHDIPVHVFGLEDFGKITSEVDTLPDFLDYLDKRQRMYDSGRMFPITSELNFLAWYKARPDQLDEAIANPKMLVVLEGDYWTEFQKRYREEIEQRRVDNVPSYVIDDVIKKFHTSIGFRFHEDSDLPSRMFEGSEVERYARITLGLSMLPRVVRRIVGRKWLEKVRAADRKGLAYSMILNEADASGILVMASDESDRHARSRALYNISSVAYCHYGLKRLLAIMTESAAAKLRSYDALLIDDVGFSNEAELRELAKSLFGARQDVSEYEFRRDKSGGSG